MVRSNIEQAKMTRAGKVNEVQKIKKRKETGGSTFQKTLTGCMPVDVAIIMPRPELG